MRTFKEISKEKILKSKLKIIFTLENLFNVFITVHARPKFSQEVKSRTDSLKEYSKVAIIIQGPLLKENNFTLHTIKLYKKLFKNYTIILSTWEGEDELYLNEMRKENVEILLNKKPEYTGISNINYQIVSTYNAIVLAKSLGMKYVLKTRTDLRIHSPSAMEFLVNLINSFPVRGEYPQNKRIALASLCTIKYRPYSISDLVMFGDINDMETLWGVPWDERKKSLGAKTMGAWSKLRMAEVYLSTHYLEKLGRKLEWTIQDSWRMYADHFCVFDNISLDIYWHKYIRINEYRQLVYKQKNGLQEMTFGEWLNIYKNIDNFKDIPEHILDEEEQFT